MAIQQTLQNVVIVGGGGAGTPTANKLSGLLDPKKYNIILINSRPFFTHLPAVIRAAVSSEDSLEDKIFIPFDRTFVKGNGQLVVDTVVAIEESENGKGGSVVLQTGRKIEYSILVLTPGSTWEGPVHVPNGNAEVKKWAGSWRKQFADAQDIVIVGGGSVGIEHAGEVKELWPEKRVTIVHGQDLPMSDTYPTKWRNGITKRLKARGVDLVLSDYVDSLDASAGFIKTRRGKTITADLVIPARGGKPNTSFIKTLSEEVLTGSGHIKVKPTFQLVNHPRIFAAGDAIDWDEQKQVAKYPAHAEVVTKNVVSILSNKKPAAVYKGSPEMIAVTLGKTGGAGYIGIGWGFTLGDKVTSMLKSKTLAIPIARKALGYAD